MITKTKSGRKTFVLLTVVMPFLTAICFVVVTMFSIAVFAQKQQINFVPVKEKAEKEKPQKDKGKSKVYKVAEKMPEYPGGFEVVQNYIGSNVKYPALAKEWGITSSVYISFVVDEEGNTTNVEVLKINSAYADEKAKKASKEVYGNAVKEMKDEALRVITNIPGKWIPGEEKGKKVAVQFTIPIKFNLK